MSPETTHIEAAVLERLLSRAAAGPAGAGEDVPVAEYDWTVPNLFVPAQLKRLDDFGKRAAEVVSEGLKTLLRDDLRLLAAPIRQHYALALRRRLSGTTDYCIPLAVAEGQRCGLFQLPLRNALSWVDRLLGGGLARAEEEYLRELSTVEQQLLWDIVATVTAALSAASRQAGGPAFEYADTVSSGEADLPGQDADGYCLLAFRSRPSESPDAGEGAAGEEAAAGPAATLGASLLLRSDVLEPIALGAAGAAAPEPAGETRKKLLAHLERVDVAAAARLGKIHVPMRDILALEPGDVLVMDTGLAEPIELLAEGAVVLSGFPARCGGRYAMKITAAGGSGDADPTGRSA